MSREISQLSPGGYDDSLRRYVSASRSFSITVWHQPLIRTTRKTKQHKKQKYNSCKQSPQPNLENLTALGSINISSIWCIGLFIPLGWSNGGR